MRGLRTLLMMLGVLAALLAGAGMPASAAEATEPPCHEAMQTDRHHGADPNTDTSSMKAMACCLACVVTARPLPAAAIEPLVRAGAAYMSRPAHTLKGRAPAPEPGPPRG